MECIYSMGTSSASHTYGNVASFIRVLLEDMFPANFFQYIHIDSKIAWRNVNEVLGNDGSEFKARHYPFMIITPRFNENDQSRYLYNTPLTKNMDNAVAGLTRNTLFPAINDREHGINLSFKLNRDSVTFDVEFRLRSLMQQIDVFKNLENQLILDRPYTQKASLESMIPRMMVAYLGKIAGIDISDSTEDDNKVPLIMRFLNSHAKNPITYKVRNSTSVEEFFMYYSTNVLLTITDLAMGEPSKRNSLEEYYPITMRITAEFNLPGMYALIGSHERKFTGLRFDAIVSSDENGGEMIPFYTYTNLYDRFELDSMDGFQFYSATIVKSDEDKKGKDEIVSIREIIPKTHMEVLDTYIRDGVPHETLFRFRLLKDDHELPCNHESDLNSGDWAIDWVKKNIIIHNSDPTVTYRIVVNANLMQINQRLASIQDSLKKDLPEIPTQN